MADDQPMWGNNRAVAPTPGVAITAIDLGDNFTVKDHHLSMIKDRQFDGRARAVPYKDIAKFVKFQCYHYFRRDETSFHKPILSTSKVQPTHGRNSRHGLGRGTIIQIFYHGLDKATQAILDANGIFLYKTPSEAHRRFEMDSYGGPHPSLGCDDKPMGSPKDEEANYAYEGYRGGGYRGNYYGKSFRNWHDRQPRDDNQNSKPREDNPSNPPTPEKQFDESDFEKNMREFMPVNPNTKNTFIRDDSEDEADEAEKEVEMSSSKQAKFDPPPLKAYKPKIPYPQRLRKEKMEERYTKFIDLIKEVRINVVNLTIL
ncbi:hypothetical protein Tco_0585266 [Tanacetum coccineum]